MKNGNNASAIPGTEKRGKLVRISQRVKKQQQVTYWRRLQKFCSGYRNAIIRLSVGESVSVLVSRQ